MRIGGLVGFLMVLGCAAPAAADVVLPAVFSDHMVLQRDLPIHVWGTADPEERVSVRIGRRSARTRADADGRWQVDLEALPAGGPHVLRVKGNNTVQVGDVLVGEVWVCSGQSNMSWPVARARDATAEIAAATWPSLRLCTVDRKVAASPQEDAPIRGWAPCTPESVRTFSAVAYYFGRELQQTLDIPVGLIHTSWGGTPVEAWTPRPTLEATAAARPYLDRWQKNLAAWDASRKGRDPRLSPHQPATLWNAMAAPLVPLTFRGVIWYQGESNASRAWHYRTVFPAMIEAWRAAWGRDDLPFYFVQLANFKARKEAPGESAWAELRDAQRHTLATLPQTGMAVAIDIGEAKDIHPKNKQEVGRRLALWALANDYLREVVCSGPLFERLEVAGARAILHFDHVGGGLACVEGETPRGFVLAGEDGVWHRAYARIDGDTVVLVHPQVPVPKAVRYAWADNPEATLRNVEGLPASPFRTDDAPLTTEPRPPRREAQPAVPR